MPFHFLNTLASLKARVESELTKPDGLFISEEINDLLYTAKTDEDIELVLKAIRRYETLGEHLGSLKYCFGSPLMRLLYTLDKTDKALELFFNEVKIF